MEKGYILMARSIEISERNRDNILISDVNSTLCSTVVKSFE